VSVLIKINWIRLYRNFLTKITYLVPARFNLDGKGYHVLVTQKFYKFSLKIPFSYAPVSIFGVKKLSRCSFYSSSFPLRISEITL